MRVSKKLEPNVRAAFMREILGTSEALSRSENGRESSGPVCNFHPCEHGLMVCGTCDNTVPFEAVITQRWQDLADQMVHRFEVRYRNVPTFDINLPLFRVIWTWVDPDGLSVFVEGADENLLIASDSADAVLTGLEDTEFKTRFYFDETIIRAKVWLASDPEPDDWTVTASEDWEPLRFDVIENGFDTLDGGTFRITEIEWVSAGKTETFTRTESSTWGLSEFNGREWATESNPEASVDGDEAIFEAVGIDSLSTQLFVNCDEDDQAGCSITYQDGEVIILDGDSSQSVLTYDLTVSGSNDTYTFPTDVEEVSNVWLDQMPTDAWDFVPEENALIFPEELSVGTQILVRYI